MVFIPRWEKYKDKKPSGLVEVNYANELAKGLKVAMMPEAGMQNLAIETLTTATNPLVTNEDQQKNWIFDRSTDTTIDTKYSNSSIAEHSCFLITRHRLLLSVKLETYVTNRVSANNGFAFYTESASGSFPNQTFRCGYVHGGVAAYTSSYTITGSNTNFIPIGFAAKINSAVDFYVNGKNVDSVAIGSINNNSDTFRIGKDGFFNSALLHNEMPVLYHFDRQLSEEEFATLSENPYQILKPRQKFFVMSGMDGSVKKAIRSNQSISTISRSSEVVSVTLSSAYPNNALKVGDTIVIDTDGGTTSFDGEHTITSVASQTSFTYNQPGVDASGSLGASPTAGGHYASLSSWVAAMQSTYPNLVTSDVVLIAECYNDWPSGLNDQVGITGFTTDSTRNIIVRAADGHQHTGIPGTGFWLYFNTNGVIFSLGTGSNVVVDGIEINSVGSSYSYSYLVQLGTLTILQNCLCVADAKTHQGIKFMVGAGGNFSIAPKAINCIVFNAGTSGAYRSNAGGSFHAAIAYNCSAIDSTVGFSTGNSEMLVQNCLAYNCTTSYQNSFYSTSSNNAASDGSTVTPPGTNPLTVNIVSSDFVDPANGDFSIPSTSQLRDAGADLSAEGFTTDILGNPRGV